MLFVYAGDNLRNLTETNAGAMHRVFQKRIFIANDFYNGKLRNEVVSEYFYLKWE